MGSQPTPANPDAKGLLGRVQETVLGDQHQTALHRIDEVLTTETPVDVEEVLLLAARLTPVEYEPRRKQLAKRLQIRPPIFDQEVARRRPAAEDDEEADLQGQTINITDVEPWPDAVDGASLLNEIANLFHRYISFNKDSDADAAALYALGTYCFDYFALFPFLGISAVGENSGKTTLGKCFKRVVFRPIPTNNITPAALFRLIAMYQGTLIIDEMDTFLNPDSELYGILNSGHDKEMAYVIRTVGEDHEPRSFSTWCPRVWSMISLPKRTVTSRSIIIQLMRKPSDKKLERLPKPDQMGVEWTNLRRRCVRWATDNKDRIQKTEVDVVGLVNRASDNWEPLFVLAEVAGGDWPKRAKAAAGIYNIVEQENVNIVLLRDIRNIFHTRKASKLPCAFLTSDLCCQEESPWPHYEHGQPLTVNQLGNLVSALGIKSQQIKLTEQLALNFGVPGWKGKNTKGFKLEQFQPLFDSYLSGEEPEHVEVSKPPM